MHCGAVVVAVALAVVFIILYHPVGHLAIIFSIFIVLAMAAVVAVVVVAAVQWWRGWCQWRRRWSWYLLG